MVPFQMWVGTEEGWAYMLTKQPNESNAHGHALGNNFSAEMVGSHWAVRKSITAFAC